MKSLWLHLRNRPNLIFASSVAMFALAAALLATTLYLQHQPRKASIAQTPYPVGQLVSMGSVSMKLNSVSYSDGKPHFPAPPSQQYVIVDLTITNLSEKPVNVLPATDIYLKQSTGEVAYLTPFELDQPFHAGELSPGETVRGQISFAAPKTAQYKLYIDSIWSGGVIPFSTH